MDNEKQLLSFIGSDFKSPEEALFQILPVPLEKSVCYGKGTAGGPEAIIKASQLVELYDCKSIPAEFGINTRKAVDCEGSAEDVIKRISEEVKKIIDIKKIPVMLGGEHTITYGALLALKQKYERIGVIQFDSHTDLRDIYFDNHLSHGCVMRRALDAGAELFEIGIRSLSFEEELLRRKLKIGHLDAEYLASNPVPAQMLPEDFPKDIYITFDVDAFDPSLIPATGTPEPGGLSWYQVIRAIENIIPGRHVIGMDFNELAPIPGMHAPDFTIARLIYNVFGIITRTSYGAKEL